ncbi:MAG TPA: hypothetical protein VI306_20440 [Pyrinomonadaceae bacterium]
MGFKDFEYKHERLAPLSVFIARVFKAFGIACIIIGGALSIGVIGYHWLAGFGLVDSILEASMILGGMGPVNPLPNTASKLFASAYALFSGLIFIGVMGIVLTPMAHRLLHKFHLEKHAPSDSPDD